MTISTFPQTSLGGAAAAVVSQLEPPGVQRIPCPDDPTWRALRSSDITASVAAALIGEHEWETAYSLYQAKAGTLESDVEDSGPVRRGRLLEPVAVQVLREEHPDWIIRHNSGEARAYYRDATARMGATPDVEARDPSRGPGVVQIKSVEASVFRQKWRNEGGEIEPPLWIAVQAIVEAALTGAEWAAVAPIVVGHGVDVPLIDIPLNSAPAIMARLRKEVSEFWRRIEEDDPPPPDYARDGAVIGQLYAEDDGAEVDLFGDRVWELLEQRDKLKNAERAGAAASKERAIIDAEIIHMLGNAQRGRLSDGRIVEAKTINRKPYAVAASSYRAVKVK
ncbi:YqaJ viral recombinase family protein [Methylocystis sp. JR02]|uniref:YqaJ viral recombinase family protein n=1 Tax=Methylocystis sp. JR02 TaxID=3046284 RepID=UPI0024B95388|nr:YqaJ viral recombinase family protein [Methylocystis sp. JR02]MDJ0449214.1 YqaJ viral recombinase family protein [Methylocystis sp. JR02]